MLMSLRKFIRICEIFFIGVLLLLVSIATFKRIANQRALRHTIAQLQKKGESLDPQKFLSSPCSHPISPAKLRQELQIQNLKTFPPLTFLFRSSPTSFTFFPMWRFIYDWNYLKRISTNTLISTFYDRITSWSKIVEFYQKNRSRIAAIRRFLIHEKPCLALTNLASFRYALPLGTPRVKQVSDILFMDFSFALGRQEKETALEDLEAIAQCKQLLMPFRVLFQVLYYKKIHEDLIQAVWAALQFPEWTDEELKRMSQTLGPPLTPELATVFRFERVLMVQRFEDKEEREKILVPTVRDISAGRLWALRSTANNPLQRTFGYFFGRMGENLGLTLSYVYSTILVRSYVTGWRLVQYPLDEKIYLEYMQSLIELVEKIAQTKNFRKYLTSSSPSPFLAPNYLVNQQLGVTVTSNGVFYFKGIALPPISRDTVQNQFGYLIFQCVRTDTLTEMARAAIALHRYKKRYGTYPDQLKDLVPEFLTSLPWDWLGGEPLHYKKINDTQFLLWSVGANGKDDGGSLSLTFPFPTNQPLPFANWTYTLDLVWPIPGTEEDLKQCGLQ